MIIKLFDEINSDTLKHIMDQTSGLSPGDEVTFMIANYGGEILEAKAIIDYIKLKGFKSTAIILGFACSAASILALSCDKCYMSSESSLMLLHSAWADELTTDDPGIIACNALQLEVIRKRCPNFSSEFLKQDTWLDATKCCELNLIDDIYNIEQLIDDDIRIAAQLSISHFMRGIHMEEIKKDELIEEVKEEVAENEEEIKSEEHDLIAIISKLEERVAELEERIAKVEAPTEAIEADEEGEDKEADDDKERIEALYARVARPMAKVAVGNVEREVKRTNKPDYKAFAKFIKG